MKEDSKMTNQFDDLKNNIYEHIIKNKSCYSLDSKQAELFFGEVFKNYPVLGEKFITSFYSKMASIPGSDTSCGFLEGFKSIDIQKTGSIKPIGFDNKTLDLLYPFPKDLNEESQKLFFDFFIRIISKKLINKELTTLTNKIEKNVEIQEKNLSNIFPYVINSNYALITGVDTYTKLATILYSKYGLKENPVKSLLSFNTQCILENNNKIYCFKAPFAFSVKSDVIFKLIHNPELSAQDLLQFEYNYAFSLDNNINAHIFQIEDK